MVVIGLAIPRLISPSITNPGPSHSAKLRNDIFLKKGRQVRYLPSFFRTCLFVGSSTYRIMTCFLPITLQVYIIHDYFGYLVSSLIIVPSSVSEICTTAILSPPFFSYSPIEDPSPSDPSSIHIFSVQPLAAILSL